MDYGGFSPLFVHSLFSLRWESNTGMAIPSQPKKYQATNLESYCKGKVQPKQPFPIYIVEKEIYVYVTMVL